MSREGGGLLGGGSETFQVKFTDAGGLGHELHGVRKVTLSDLPKLVNAPMPLRPGMFDREGKPVVEGMTYTWSDGTKARLKNGTWEPVQVPNEVCLSK